MRPEGEKARRAIGGLKLLALAAASVLLASCAPGYVGYTHSPSFTDEGTGVLRISEGLGGDFSGTWQRIRKLQKDNVLFVVDGRCASACTLVLDEAYPHVCWTDQAEFLFHGAAPRHGKGAKGASSIANLLLVGKLPDYVREQLPPASNWTPYTWFTIKSEDMPSSGHCEVNARYLAMKKDGDGNWIAPYDGPPMDNAISAQDVSDRQFLENVRKSLAQHPRLQERIRETMKGLRPHLSEQIAAME